MRKARALCLLSGGLDSQLAVCVLREQGVEPHGIAFESPFFGSKSALKAAAKLGIPLHVEDFTGDILELLRDPPHGFGSCMNPCIDCHARMLRRAGRLMEKLGLDFLATGEVLDERPMSQNRTSLEIVARDSQYGELVLRPLSARLLPETRPEREGLVDRARLLSLRGRSRKPQIALAAKYGLSDYPTPAGGCLLTDPGFSRRLRDLMSHEPNPSLADMSFLKIGRHFRLGRRTKLVLGRNMSENEIIEREAGTRPLLKVESFPGPIGVVCGEVSDELVRTAAGLCVRYSDAPRGQKAMVRVRSGDSFRIIEAEAAAESSLNPI